MLNAGWLITPEVCLTQMVWGNKVKCGGTPHKQVYINTIMK